MQEHSNIPTTLPDCYVPWGEITASEAAEYETALAAAGDEGAMQRFLQDNPRFLLQHLPARSGYWVVPKKRLGADYETDFMIAEDDGGTLVWRAVELERPQARLFNAKGDPAAFLTHALRQISDWRQWLSYNRDYASRSTENSGLGLRDIEPELEGLIIMGRDSHLSTSVNARLRRLMRDHRLGIYTYDWLLRQAKERLSTRARHTSWIEDLLLAANERDSPDKIASNVFGSIGSASMDISATRTVEWKFVSIEVGGADRDIAFEGVSGFSVERELTLHDWEDWIIRVGEEGEEPFTLLASEIRPTDQLQQSLTLLDEGIWHEVQERRLSTPSRVDVLLHLPRSLSQEEKRERMRTVRVFFERQIPLAREGLLQEIIDPDSE